MKFTGAESVPRSKELTNRRMETDESIKNRDTLESILAKDVGIDVASNLRDPADDEFPLYQGG